MPIPKNKFSSSATAEAKQTREEREERLWDRFFAAAGDEKKELTKEVVEFYLPLVAYTVEQLSIQVRNHIDREELVSIGVLGLHDAISRYSRSHNTKFATFAKMRIRGAVLDELRSRDPLTRDQRQAYHKICETIARMVQELERFPTNVEIAERMGIDENDVERAMSMGGEVMALDEEVESGVKFMDIIPCEKTETPSESAIRNSAFDAMRKAIRELTTKEQQLLFLRHHEDLRVKEIAAVFGVSSGRICQMYNAIITKLRSIMKIAQDEQALK